MLVAKLGKAVAAPVEPKLNVPEVRLSVPVEATWKPPSLKRLFAVVLPMVSVVTGVALPSVTPADVFMVRLLTLVPVKVEAGIVRALELVN